VWVNYRAKREEKSINIRCPTKNVDELCDGDRCRAAEIRTWREEEVVGVDLSVNRDK